MVTVVIRLHGRFDDAGGQAGFPWIFGPNWRPLMRQFRTKFVPACHSSSAHRPSPLFLFLPYTPFPFLLFTARCYACAVYAMALSVSPSIRLSVRPSVTSRCSTTITQTTPHDSAGTLFFCCQRSPRNSTGIIPCGGSKCRWAGSESATFDK